MATTTTTSITTTTDAAAEHRALPTEMLERFRQRAAGHDRENTYFHEDLDELRSVGYLAAVVPTHLGGW